MRDFKINYEYLSERDQEFLKEIANSKEIYGIHYVGKSYRFCEKNEDGGFSIEKQKQIFMETRQAFAQWKLKRIRSVRRHDEKMSEYYRKMELSDEILTIKKEKRELFYEFKYNVQSTLDNYAQCNWQPFWRFYYEDNTQLKKIIARHSDENLIIAIDDATYI